MNITVIGAGYVGLVTGACLAEMGHIVTCLDTNHDKIEMLRRDQVPIFEPGLHELIRSGTAAGRLGFTTEYADTIPGSDLVMIAVGTPTGRNATADLTWVMEAADSIAKLASGATTVAIKSTVPVGTTMEVEARLNALRPDIQFEMASNPEFLRQGAAVEDFMRPARLVFGTRTERAAEIMRRVYQPVLNQGCPVVFTNIETAELIKYASNAFLAIKLSYINEIADVCEEAGCDIGDVTAALGLDPRISENFLRPGPGYGGSCLPKDTQALLHTTQQVGVPSRVVAAAIDVNAARPARMAAKIARAAGGSVSGKTVAVLGITFKANTDDLRESPALKIVRSLIGAGANVCIYDPQGMHQAKAQLSSVDFANDTYQCVTGADVVVILTEWAEFSTLDLERIGGLMTGRVIVDLRNLYDPDEMGRAGFDYHTVGR